MIKGPGQIGLVDRVISVKKPSLVLLVSSLTVPKSLKAAEYQNTCRFPLATASICNRFRVDAPQARIDGKKTDLLQSLYKLP